MITSMRAMKERQKNKALRRQRGEIDGERGRPPSEASEDYLDGYADGSRRRQKKDEY